MCSTFYPPSLAAKTTTRVLLSLAANAAHSVLRMSSLAGYNARRSESLSRYVHYYRRLEQHLLAS